MKKCSILKLQTDNGLLEGHSECAAYLEKTVEDLLLNPAYLDEQAQEILLNEIELVFTEEDNQLFLLPPTKKDIWNTICESNLNAAPGLMEYKVCFIRNAGSQWEILF